MERENLLQCLLSSLAKADNIYDGRRSQEELASLALVYAEALEEATRIDRTGAPLREAFLEHIRESVRFPRPKDIIERLPYARIKAHNRQRKTRALAEGQGKRTEGLGPAICRAWLGDEEAFRRLQARGYLQGARFRGRARRTEPCEAGI